MNFSQLTESINSLKETHYPQNKPNKGENPIQKILVLPHNNIAKLPHRYTWKGTFCEGELVMHKLQTVATSCW